MKETPSGATRQCRRSKFASDEARSGQERAKSIANLIERSFKVAVDLQRTFRKMLCLRAALEKTMVNYISLES